MQLTIDFKTRLNRWELEDVTNKWIRFSRWLPDGQNDAIEHVSSDGKVKLAFWFLRHGHVRDKFVEFELDRNEVPEEVMRRQAALDSGPLYGRITTSDVAPELLKAVSQENRGDPAYTEFAKGLIKKHLQPSLNRFSNIVRYRFGQYWIRDFPQWDSRSESIGHYCKGLSMRASVDDGKTWHEFMPDEPSASIHAECYMVDADSLIKQEDWEAIRKDFAQIPEPSVALQVLGSVHELLDRGDMRHALVEIATALKIAVDARIRHAAESEQYLADAVKAFYDSPLKTKVTTIGLACGVDREDLTMTVQAIRARNKLVHEAKYQPEDCRKWLRASLRVCASLLNLPACKFPTGHGGNSLDPFSSPPHVD